MPSSPAADGPVLLTGFAPFAGARSNPSWEAVRRAAPLLREDGVAVETRELPVVFDRAGDEVVAAIEELRPSLVVAVGLADGRAAITPERVAINVRDARIPDEAGAQPVDEPVREGGPVGRFSTLPIKAMTAAAAELGVPASVSQTAGTFVCNDVFYRVLHALEGSGVRGGFVHVPSAEVVDVERGAAALAAMVRAALSTSEDLARSGGAEH